MLNYPLLYSFNLKRFIQHRDPASTSVDEKKNVRRRKDGREEQLYRDPTKRELTAGQNLIIYRFG